MTQPTPPTLEPIAPAGNKRRHYLTEDNDAPEDYVQVKRVVPVTNARNVRAQLGDRKTIYQGYEATSTCAMIQQGVLARVAQAEGVLDRTHATKLEEAAANLSRSRTGKFRTIPIKKAIALAVKADEWVYQAQAAAAKKAKFSARKCRRELLGRAKLSKTEKEARYLKRFGVPRPPMKADRTLATNARARAKRQRVAEAKAN